MAKDDDAARLEQAHALLKLGENTPKPSFNIDAVFERIQKIPGAVEDLLFKRAAKFFGGRDG
jgi:hypothetical protein